jgi:hypothetical protein
MNWKKWMLATVSTVMARRYPVLWTAAFFAAIPALLRSASTLSGGVLLLVLGRSEVESAPLIALAAFAPGAIGVLKYGSRAHVLACMLWVATFLSVAVLGIVMFEAFSPPWQWSGSFTLPGLVVGSCGVGVMGGAIVLQAPWYRRRTGRCTPR